MDDKSPGASSSHPQTQISDVPHLLIIDILSRLPIKSLFSCKCVCRTWLSLLLDPFFVNLQLAKSPTCLLVRPVAEKRRLRFAQLVEEIAPDRFAVDSMELVANVSLPDSEFDCVNACNGLLCLVDWSSTLHQQIIYVCNPMLGEYISIPTPGNREKKHWAKFGLGFSSSSSQFKVLQMSYSDQNGNGVPYMSELYTIGDGTGQWRSIGAAPYHPPSFFDSNTSMNGSIHWVPFPEDRIAYFDFESEKFGSLPLPSQCYGKRFKLVKLGVLDGCLWMSFSTERSPQELEIWVMKEYGVKESWAKMFTFDKLHEKGYDFQYHELLYLLRNQKILILHYEGGVVCYDGISDMFLGTNVIEARGYSIATAYNPCFVPLQNVARGEELTILSVKNKVLENKSIAGTVIS